MKHCIVRHNGMIFCGGGVVVIDEIDVDEIDVRMCVRIYVWIDVVWHDVT